MPLFQRNLLCTQDWSVDEIDRLIEIAEQMRRERHAPAHREILAGQSFFMMFQSPSLRTRLSFATAVAELGGQAVEVFPEAARIGARSGWREATGDVARVMASYGAGTGIRTHDASAGDFGEGAAFVRDFAASSNRPVVSMGDDGCHPCQGLADLAGLRTHLGRNLKKKRILVTWARGVLSRSRSSTQAILLIASRMGMDVTLAHPEGYELDPAVVAQAERNSVSAGGSLRLTNDSHEGYAGQDVVFSRNWVSTEAYRDGVYQGEQEVQRAMHEQYEGWCCTAEKMLATADGLFLNPMPVDRGREATDEVASGSRSMIYDVAENRLHVQKAYLALAMNEVFSRKFGP